MTTHRQIYLVPGFFGFTGIGDISYFQGVEDMLRQHLRERAIDATVVTCPTRPTASIRRRARDLLATVVEAGGLDADELHFIGHSTGGLDVRLLVTPGVDLDDSAAEMQLALRTATVTTVATPHHGTPLASFFTTLPGRHLLELLAVLASSSPGRMSLFWASEALQLYARLDDLWGARDTFLDGMAERVLSKLTNDPDDPMWAFFRQVATDQGAIIQLTPEALDLFNAAVCDAEDVSYGCVVTAAPPPPGNYHGTDLRTLSRLLFAGAFTLLHTLAGREHRHYPYPEASTKVAAALREAFSFPIDHTTNDGIVPALSQVHGRLLYAAQADHLDVIGQYATGEPSADWLPSGAGYDRYAFDATWKAVALHIAESIRPSLQAGAPVYSPVVVPMA